MFLVQLHPADVIAQGAHRCARLDGLELEGSPTTTSFASSRAARETSSASWPIPEHARLVDHEHAAEGEPLDLELVKRGCHRGRSDVRALLEELRGASGQGAADHLDAGSVEDFTADLERVGLPTPASPSITSTRRG